MKPIGLFNGQCALVTGSASNIGRAIAEALAAEGARVLLADIDPERNAATLAAITAAAVVFLASTEAGYITGHTLNVNGGMVML